MSTPAQELVCNDPIEFTSEEYKSKRIRYVLFITLITFFVEAVAGTLTHSMALTADAWHMLTHIMAFAINLIGYRFAARYAADRRFHFGVSKVNALAGYTSALLLFAVAVWMMIESVMRFWHPQPIYFRDALIVAVIGLVINLIAALILIREPHHHDDHHHHDHDHDHNYRSAYLHVLADAFTSLLAILALLGGMYFQWIFLDPVIGVLGGVVVGVWAYGLFRSSGLRLLDYSSNRALQNQIIEKMQALSVVTVLDFHLWPHDEQSYYLMMTVQAPSSMDAASIRRELVAISEIKHATIEVMPLNRA